MGLILQDDVSEMRGQVRCISEACAAMRGALIAADNGSDGAAVLTILLDSAEVIDAALAQLSAQAKATTAQQGLPLGEASLGQIAAAARRDAVVDVTLRRGGAVRRVKGEDAAE